jgi:hypothetical protein
MVVPMGRTSAEVTRATMLAKHVGKPRAVAGAGLMQSMTMMANAIVSSLCLAALLVTTSSSALTIGLLLNIGVTLSLGLGAYLVMQHVSLGGFLGRRFSKFAQAGPEVDALFRESKVSHFKALSICVFSRLIQTMQYGVIFFAVVGAISPASPWISEGIQLVGRSAGDMVPNQVGITEGAFALFAPALGLAEHPHQAVSIALLARISNLTIAGLCAVLLQFRSKAVPTPA